MDDYSNREMEDLVKIDGYNKSNQLSYQVSQNQHFLNLLVLFEELQEMPLNYAKSLPVSNRGVYLTTIEQLNHTSTKNQMLLALGYNTQVFDSKVNSIQNGMIALTNDIPLLASLSRNELTSVLNNARTMNSSGSTKGWVCQVEYMVCSSGAILDLAVDTYACWTDDPTLTCVVTAATNYLINSANCIGNWAECEGWT